MDIQVSLNGRSHTIRLEDVLYFEAFGDDCFCVTMLERYKVRLKLYETSEYKNKGFVRIGKSYTVNVFKIISLTPQINSKFKLRMKNQEVLYVNRAYLKEFKMYLKKGEYKND